MTLQACADSVAKADPDRFAATLAAPVDARRVLFPLYAFNVEVSRAPWVTEEPMIAEMRLQWWRDALEEIGSDKPVRAHEVTQPLSEVLAAEGAEVLDKLVQARRWDVYKDAFEDEAHLDEYLDATGGGLMYAAARALDTASHQTQEDVIRRFGRGAALARFLAAVPELEARGRIPLVDGRPEAIAALANRYLADMPSRKMLYGSLRPPVMAATIEGWQAHKLLAQIVDDPGRVAEGRVGLSPFRKRWSLLRWA